MSKLIKLGLVLGGYVMACVITSAVVYVRGLLTQDAAAQASAGMYAGGDFILFVALLGFLSLFPTGLGIYFLIRKFVTKEQP